MPDRHKHGGLSWHPPGELSVAARQQAKHEGRHLSSLLTDALAAYLEAAGVECTTVESTRPVAAPPVKRAARRSAAPAAATAAPEPKPVRQTGKPPGCDHVYPDVRNVAGIEVCRKCPA